MAVHGRTFGTKRAWYAASHGRGPGGFEAHAARFPKKPYAKPMAVGGTISPRTAKAGAGIAAAGAAAYGGYRAKQYISNRRNAKTGTRTVNPKPLKTQSRVRRKR